MASDAWYLPYAEWAVANGIITAPGRAFDPEGAVTRADAAVMFIAAFAHLSAVDQVQGVFADNGNTPEASVKAVEGIHAAGLTKGCATGPLRYCPHRPITRAQAATMLSRSIVRAEPTVGLIINRPQAARGYTLINTLLTGEIHLIDYLGRRVHSWRLEEDIIVAKLLETGNLMYLAYGRVVEVDSTGNIVWEYGGLLPHHDFLKLPNGNVLLLFREYFTSSELVHLGARLNPTSKRWWFDYIQEVKPTGLNSGEVVWEWRTWDHLIQDHDPDKPNYGTVAANPRRIDINYRINHTPLRNGWIHTNALDYNLVLDQIVLSARQYSELWIIDHNTTTEEAARAEGDLLYRWGNPRTYGAGDYQDQQLFWQHNIHWIPEGLPGQGNVLIFNNGNEFTGSQRLYSSIDEITLPPLQDSSYPQGQSFAFEPAQLQWTYTASNPADFYEYRNSSAQRLPNGNTQICSGVSGIVFQVTPDGTTVWKYINPIKMDGTSAYQGDDLRSYTYHAPWYPPNYPGLRNMDLMPKGLLELNR